MLLLARRTTLFRKTFFPAMLLLGAASALADELSDAERLENQRQKAFVSDMTTIVDAMNTDSFDPLLRAIDKRDMTDRILGLRLIDQRIKKSFNEDYEYKFPRLVESQFKTSKEAPKARLIVVESRGTAGRAVVRLDQENFQFNYIEFELALDKSKDLVVVDWTDHAFAHRFSDAIGLTLVLGQPSKAAIRKLMQVPGASEREVFQFGELLKAARDGELERYLAIRDDLPQRLRELRLVAELSVDVAKRLRKRRQMVSALEELNRLFPAEPRYALMLLDYFFPKRKYDDAILALEGFYRIIGADDAAMEARLSAAQLVNNEPNLALSHAEKAIELEPELELGWWSLLNARVKQEDFSGAVAAMQQLEAEFGYSLGPDALKRDRSYQPLVASAEYQAWRADK